MPSPLQSTSVPRLGPSQPTSVDFSRPPQTSVGFGLRPKPRGLGLRRREDGVPCSCRTRCCCYRLLPAATADLLPAATTADAIATTSSTSTTTPTTLHYTTLRCTTIAPALPALPFSSQVEISPFRRSPLTAPAGSAIAPITSPAAASGGGPYLATARHRPRRLRHGEAGPRRQGRAVQLPLGQMAGDHRGWPPRALAAHAGVLGALLHVPGGPLRCMP